METNQCSYLMYFPNGKKERDHQVIAAQVNVCLALHCFQAQSWVQSTVAAIVGNGEEGTLLTVRGNLG